MIFFSACEFWTTAFSFPAIFVVAEWASTRRLPVYMAAVTVSLGSLALISDRAAETVIDHQDALVLATMATETPELRPLFREANADGRLTLDEWRSIRKAERVAQERNLEKENRKALAIAEARLKALNAHEGASAR